MDTKTAALTLIAESNCEVSHIWSCSQDMTRSPYAQYLAYRWCMPCIARAGLDGSLPAKPVFEAEAAG